MTVKLKVYELAKQLGIDNQYLLEICKRLGVDTKNSMSVLGSEEVKSVREFYEKHRAINKKDSSISGKGPVTESRVGSAVIRRRVGSKAEAEGPAAPVEEPVAAPEVEAAPPEETVPEVTAAPVMAEEVSEPSVEVEPAPVAAKAAVEEKPGTKHKPIVKRSVMEAPPPPKPKPKVTHSILKAPAQHSMTAAPAAPTPPAATPAPTTVAPLIPSSPMPQPAPVKRRMFPSIIKKVSVETHLLDTVGPKREAPVKKPTPAVAAKKPGEEDAGGLRRVKEVTMGPAPVEAATAANKRRTNQQNTVFRSADYLKRELVHATKKKRAAARPAQKTMITTMAEHKRIVDMGEKISVSDLANQMGIKASALIKKLMELGVAASMNEAVDHDTATLAAHEFGWGVKQEVFKEETFIPKTQLEEGDLEPRGPVVTIMGHVDHGKTSLLDSIRKADVAAGEAGGITQHIGAYTVAIPNKGTVTFIDTPGHEAFTAMRARGAKVTDIVVLVVSAVDGVMPQTLESVAHAKAGNVPIVVALNKSDLPDANPDRIKQTLAGHDLAPEDWGGSTIYVSVSAKTGKGIPELLDSILVQAEVLELKANHKTSARGTVIESRIDKNRGAVATVLVQQGTLRLGDIAIAGTAFGKVRAMNDCYGKPVKEAGPSMPVEILGLGDASPVGEEMAVVEDEKTARSLVDGRNEKTRIEAGDGRPKMTLEEMMATGGTTKELRVILKSDVVGSLEAIKVALSKIPDDKVKLKILHTATGGISESDVNLAVASRTAILGFNVRPDNNARRKADAEKVEIRTYSIIYEIVDEVKALMEGLLDRQVKETVIGHAEVRNVFNVPKVGTIAGSAVTDGKVTRGSFLRVVRDSRVVYEGKVSSLRRFKDDVKEVSSGYECGITVENFNDLKLGDRFEAFVKEEVKSSL